MPQKNASLGTEGHVLDGFMAYMGSVHAFFADYRYAFEDLVTTENIAAARMTFTGTHQTTFLGIEATGRTISWIDETQDACVEPYFRGAGRFWPPAAAARRTRIDTSPLKRDCQGDRRHQQHRKSEVDTS